MDKIDAEYVETLVDEINRYTAPLIAGSDGRTAYAFAVLAARTLALATKDLPQAVAERGIVDLIDLVRQEFAAQRAI